jgi:hypothetical protein
MRWRALNYLLVVDCLHLQEELLSRISIASCLQHQSIVHQCILVVRVQLESLLCSSASTVRMSDH